MEGRAESNLMPHLTAGEANDIWTALFYDVAFQLTFGTMLLLFFQFQLTVKMHLIEEDGFLKHVLKAWDVFSLSKLFLGKKLFLVIQDSFPWSNESFFKLSKHKPLYYIRIKWNRRFWQASSYNKYVVKKMA